MTVFFLCIYLHELQEKRYLECTGNHFQQLLSSRLKKLSISGIQEFVPASTTSAGGQDNGVSGAAAAASDPASAAINSYDQGGTMYFYQGNDGVSRNNYTG